MRGTHVKSKHPRDQVQATETPTLCDEIAEPEAELLEAVLRDTGLVSRLARAPGGWRTLSRHELDELSLTQQEKKSVLALQELVSRGYAKLALRQVGSSEVIGRAYGERLGGLVREVMLAVALDGRNNFVGEVELASGGAHGIAITARDVFRPLMRMGASACVLVHNHPSGNPTPSEEDLTMTLTVAAVGDIVGIPVVDHVIVGARGGGYASLLDLGVLDLETRRVK